MRIFMYHGEAYGNLGDEAMLLNAVRRIRERLGAGTSFVIPKKKGAPLPEQLDADVTEIDSVGAYTQRMFQIAMPHKRWRHRLNTLARPPIPYVIRKTQLNGLAVGAWRDLMRELKGCDAVYMVGGANLNDLAATNCLLPKAMLQQAAEARGIPVVVSAQTVGPLNWGWTRGLVGRMVERSAYFSVRDGGVSLETFAKAGIPTGRVAFTGDEAYSLPEAPAEEAEELLRAGGVRAGETFGLLHFRATDYTGSTKKSYQVIAEALDASDLPYRFVFLPMSYFLHDDAKCGEEIRGLMKHPEKLCVLPCPRDARVARGVVGRAHWTMGLSYHVQVFSLAARRPVGMLSSGAYYTIKARGMKKLAGSHAQLVDLSTAKPVDLAGALTRLDRATETAREELAEIDARVREVCDQPVEELARVLGVASAARGAGEFAGEAKPLAGAGAGVGAGV